MLVRAHNTCLVVGFTDNLQPFDRGPGSGRRHWSFTTPRSVSSRRLPALLLEQPPRLPGSRLGCCAGDTRAGRRRIPTSPDVASRKAGAATISQCSLPERTTHLVFVLFSAASSVMPANTTSSSGFTSSTILAVARPRRPVRGGPV